MDKERYAIEKGIPRPEAKNGAEVRRKYPFAKMEIGDSFFIPIADEEERKRKVASVLGSARRDRHRGRFSTRKVEGGIRVWRVE